ncbi:hypothetical protein MACK_001286 [Theileria orientalis]|uniref:Uncharacterized protein n=1 Tax=Theileria orientalis TaxID=68886 RepID=A0A976QVI1_THEOR|nr:hypothetical protein MACK_001286 [Theileria orientalis]
MPYIYLDATDTKNHYGKDRTSVIKDLYTHCKLFTIYRHKSLRGSSKGNIQVYEKYNSSGFGPYVTLTPSLQYNTASLSHEEVYVNKYDPTNTPLLLVLFFKDNPNAKSRYYTRSTFQDDRAHRKNRRIYDLKLYNRETDIIFHLLEENDRLTNLLTFDISLRDTRRKGTKYNGDKILVKRLINIPTTKPDLVKLVQIVAPGGFLIYRHEPVYEYQQTPACFIYENQVLMRRNDGYPIPNTDIQNKKLNVNVYYDKGLDEPLLLEFGKRDTRSSGEDNLYYIGKKDSKGLYFEKLEPTTKELRALSLSTHGSVYSILKSANYGVLTGLLNVVKSVIEGAIIYHLDKNINDNDYKEGSIIVQSQILTSEPAISKHKHKPTTEDQNKTQLLYYKDLTIQLVPNDSIFGRIKLETLSNQKFAEITTYSLSGNDKEHLLMKLTNDKKVKYYLHRFNKNGSMWRQLSLQELKDAGVNVSNLRGTGLSQLLDKLLNEQSQSDNVKAVLNFISFSVNSIIVLLDEKVWYYQSDINRQTGYEIPPIDIDRNVINVINETKTSGTCVEKYGYRVCKHDLQIAGQFGRAKSDTGKVYLRFYLDGNYITLYDSTPTTTPIYLTYSPFNDYIWVYYYGDKDPRPLLFCYNDQAYRPSSKKDYESKWVKVENLKCTCQNDDNNKELLRVLSDVVGFLNEVELKLRKEFAKLKSGLIRSYGYIVQFFNDKYVEVKVTYHKVVDFDAYKHEPKEEGYRLGVIKYENGMPKETGLSYDLKLNLKSVTEYFDTKNYKHPLLVELEFYRDYDPNNSIGHYYSIGFDDGKKWNLMERNSGHDKEFFDQLDKLERREREKNQSLREAPKRTQPPSDDSKTQLQAANIQPALPGTPPQNKVQVKLPSEEASLSTTVAKEPAPGDTVSEGRFSRTGSTEDRPSESDSTQGNAEQPLTTQTSPEISSSRAVPENLPKGGSSESRGTEAGLGVDRSSHIGTPQGVTQREEASGKTSQVQRKEPGQQPGGQTVDEHLQLELNGNQREEQAPSVTPSINTEHREAGVTHLTIENRQDSQGIPNERITVIANEVRRIKRSLDESKYQPNIPVIAGGAASGVGLTGSVVGYFAYTKYCKAKAPIQK